MAKAIGEFFKQHAAEWDAKEALRKHTRFNFGEPGPTRRHKHNARKSRRKRK